MKNFFEYKYEIIVKVKHQLTDEEINMIKRDFAARLQGHHTECPKQLIDADIEIKGKLTNKEKKYSILSHIICFFLGHKSTSMLVETESAIFTRGCSRCGSPIGMPARWKFNVPPPRSSIEQIKAYDEYCEQQNQAVRDSIK